MKKITLLLVVTVVFNFGQTSNSNLNVGIIGGLNIANMNVEIMDEGSDVSSTTVFGIGGIIDWKLNSILGLRMEPMYLQKGIGKTELDIQPDYLFYVKSSYIELPVLIKAEFGQNIKPYLMIGPSIGMLLNTELAAEVNNMTIKGDSKNATENIDISIVLGGGLTYPLGKLSIFLEGCYYYGLTNNIKGGTIEISTKNITQELEWNKDTDSMFDRGLQLMTGVIFPL